ncbi:MAG: TIGR00725 family protein [Candidatus Heimdallarchaeota archaeon]|nr:TIGR00725 family protein [Candidatus Heimdallarchaeota archaeon]
MKDHKFQIGVIGDSEVRSKEQFDIAYEIGKEIANVNAILVCGGRGGVMTAAAKGAWEANGITVGILPMTTNDLEVSPYLTVKIPTNLHWGRNPIIPLASDGVIACGGNTGTLSELAYAELFNKPVVCLTSIPGWSQEIGLRGSLSNPPSARKILTAQTGKEAVEILVRLLRSSE